MASTTGISLIPPCAFGVTRASYNGDAANRYDLRSVKYYKGYLNEVSPGILLGGACLLCSTVYTLWLLSVVCRKNIEWGKRRASPDQQVPHWKYLRIAVDTLTVVLSLAVFGACVYGITNSLKATNGKGAAFWSLVDQGTSKVEKAIRSANETIIVLQDLRYTLNTTNQAIEVVVGGLPAVDAQSLRDTFSLISDRLEGKAWMGGLVMSDIYDNLLEGLKYIKESYKPGMQRVEHVWRYIFLGVLFGMLGISALAAGALSLTGRLPRLTAFSVFILWGHTSLIVLSGLGLFRGAYEVSKDSCLYTEDWLLRLAAQRTGGSFASDRIVRYYLGAYRVSDEAHVAREVFGIDYGDMYVLANDKNTQAALAYLRSPSGTAALEKATALTLQQRELIRRLPALLALLDTDVKRLNGEMQKPVLDPVHTAAKDILCCQLPRIFYRLWWSWSIVGVVAMVLTILLSFKVVGMVRPIATGKAYFQQEEEAKFDSGHSSELEISTNGGGSAYAYAIKDA